MTKIYALLRKSEGVYSYVGKTVNLIDRLRYHLSGAWDHNAALKEWIFRDRSSVVAVVLEEVEDESWQERERHWITKLRSEGHPLLNLAKGGARDPFSRPGRRRKGLRNSDSWRSKVQGSWTPERRAAQALKVSVKARARLSEMSEIASTLWKDDVFRQNQRTARKASAKVIENMKKIRKLRWPVKEG